MFGAKRGCKVGEKGCKWSALGQTGVLEVKRGVGV